MPLREVGQINACQNTEAQFPSLFLFRRKCLSFFKILFLIFFFSDFFFEMPKFGQNLGSLHCIYNTVLSTIVLSHQQKNLQYNKHTKFGNDAKAILKLVNIEKKKPHRHLQQWSLMVINCIQFFISLHFKRTLHVKNQIAQHRGFIQSKDFSLGFSSFFLNI